MRKVVQRARGNGRDGGAAPANPPDRATIEIPEAFARYEREPGLLEQFLQQMIISLAFVPIPYIVQALNLLEEHLPAELEPIISWFTNNYVGRLRANGTRSPPMFPHTVWNVYDRTINHQDRTNNFCEAFHRKVQLQLGFAHPTIFKFLDSLKKIVKVSDTEYENFVAGHNPQRKRRRYREADDRIFTIVNRPFDPANVLEYLRGISHNYQML